MQQLASFISIVYLIKPNKKTCLYELLIYSEEHLVDTMYIYRTSLNIITHKAIEYINFC